VTDLPKKGIPWARLDGMLDDARADDVDWRNGRIGVYIHYAGDDVLEVAKKAYQKYFSENGLGPKAFPSLAVPLRVERGMALGLLGGVVNLFWKISAHSTAIASSATIALLYWPPLGAALWACAVLVGWARVRTHNHTPMQVLAGFASAATVIVAVFELIGARG